MVLVTAKDDDGQRVIGYRESLQLCWIRSTGSGTPNTLSWLMMFVPTILFFGTSLYALITAESSLRDGLPETLQLRLRIVKESRVYNALWFVYWLVTATLYLLVFVEGDDEVRDNALLQAFAVVFGLCGVVDCVAWTWTKRPLSSESDGKDGDEPEQFDINRVLRKELIMETTRGIIRGIESLARRSEAEHLPETLREMNDRKYLFSEVCQSEASSGNFRSYAPVAFSFMRRAVGVSDADFLVSIRGADSGINEMQEKFTEGRSGSFMYFTLDKRYIVKTVTKQELQLLLQLLPALVAHRAANADSLVAPFLSAHSISMYRTTVRFVVMSSVFFSQALRQAVPMDETYDLKGSWVDRHADPRLLLGKRDIPPHLLPRKLRTRKGTTMKDNDLHVPMRLDCEMRDKLLRQIHADAEFLRDLGVMDYSLLLGVCYRRERLVHDAERLLLRRQFSRRQRRAKALLGVIDDLEESEGPHEVSTFQLHEGGVQAAVLSGPGVYYVGIIDILQTWTFKKKFERFFKTVILRKSRDGVSCVPPEPYCARFLEKVEKIALSEHWEENDTPGEVQHLEIPVAANDDNENSAVGSNALAGASSPQSHVCIEFEDTSSSEHSQHRDDSGSDADADQDQIQS
ncbi:MAG: hypothetical protein MHM6MM_006566 [Cercozoa sp. M6MM]